MEEPILSESELLVMKTIWRSEKVLSLQEIAENVNTVYGKNWKPQTVSVFLGRIVKKKLLRSERNGRQFYYYPMITEEEYCQKETLRCVNVLGDGKADVFFSALSHARDLTKEERKRIRGLLDELDGSID